MCSSASTRCAGHAVAALAPFPLTQAMHNPGRIQARTSTCRATPEYPHQMEDGDARQETKTQDKDARQRRKTKTEDGRRRRKTLGRRSEDARSRRRRRPSRRRRPCLTVLRAGRRRPTCWPPPSSLPHRPCLTTASSLQCHTFWTISRPRRALRKTVDGRRRRKTKTDNARSRRRRPSRRRRSRQPPSSLPT